MPKLDRRNELLYRVYFVLLAFFVVSLVISYRIFVISVIEGDEWRAKKERNYMVWRPMKTERGQILADDGQSILASSVEFFEIRMDPVAPSEADFKTHIDGLSQGLSKIIGKYSASEWKNKIIAARVAYKRKQPGGTRNLLIAKEVDHFMMKRIQELPLFSKGQYKGGLIKIREYNRQRPFRELAARTIGIDRDENRVGLENSFNTVLQGEQKRAYMKKVAPDLYIPVFDPTEFEIIRGNDIVTTINVNMQDIVHNELFKGLQEFDAQAATAIIMEVSTGQIKAISNLSKNSSGQIGEYKNYAISHSSEPGSTFKAASILALLEDGAYQPTSLVDFSHGKKKFYGHWMHDSGQHGIGEGELRVAFEKSSNIGIASALDDYYNKTKDWSKFTSRLEQFGLYNKTNVEIEGEPAPIIKNPIKDKRNWYNTTIPWMAHGYELHLTPLQVLNFYNTIANGGKMLKPQLVTEIKSGTRSLKKFKPVVVKESIARVENIEKLKSLLNGVVERGTGASLKSDNYTFSGKTGTTKVGYNGGIIEYNASFAGYWPAENPKYSMIIVVYGLRGSTYYGNAVAGPIFRRVMDWCHSLENENWVYHNTEGSMGKYTGTLFGYENDYLQIFNTLEVPYKQVGKWMKGSSGDYGEILNGKAKISSSEVPDVAGMGPRDAMYILENLGMKVSVHGYGRVQKQSIRAGSKLNRQQITLYLN